MRDWARLAAMAAIAAAMLVLIVAQPDALASNTTSYTYDSWGRVVGATYGGSSNVTTGYGYDPAGNRTQVGTAGVPSANPVPLVVVADSSANPVALSVSGPYASVAVPAGPAHGTTHVSGTSITYTPAAGYAGADSFTYTATNSSGTSVPATVQVAVAPLANAVPASVAANSTGNPISQSVVGAPYALALASLPLHGSASASGTSMTYTPAAGYAGADGFQYTAANSGAASPPASVSVTVTSPPPTTGPVDFPIPQNSPSTPVPLNLGGGPPTSVAVVALPSHGTTSISGLSISYEPTANFVGADSFTYSASNNGGASSPGTVQVTVTPLTATASIPANCPTGAPTYVCASGASSSNVFYGLAATCSATGGTGPYAYSWALNAAGPAVWTGENGTTSSTLTPEVTNVHPGISSMATITCTATDSSSPPGNATSNTVQYQWLNTSPD